MTVLSILFSVFFFGGIAVSYTQAPFTWKNHPILFGIFWEIIGGCFLTIDTLKPDWFSNFRHHVHDFVTLQYWKNTFVNLIRFQPNKNFNRAVFFHRMSELLLVAIGSIVLVCLIEFLFFNPFDKIIIKKLVVNALSLLLIIICIMAIFFVMETGLLPFTMTLVLAPLFFPLIVLIQILIIGPFAIGTLLYKRIQTAKESAMIGLTYVLIGAMAQATTILLPGILTGSVVFSQTIGSSVIAGNALYETYSIRMYDKEKSYYEEWSRLITIATKSLDGSVVGIVQANPKARNKDILKTQRKFKEIYKELTRLKPAPVFNTLHATTLSEIKKLMKLVNKYPGSSFNSTEIFEEMEKIGKKLEIEVENTFIAISNRSSAIGS